MLLLLIGSSSSSAGDNDKVWCGLENCAGQNLCYMNATIQALAVAFLPLQIFKNSLSEENIRICFETQHEKDLALSFLQLTGSLDLQTTPTQERAKKQIFVTTAIRKFRKSFLVVDKEQANKLERAAYRIREQYDAFEFFSYLWCLMRPLFPSSSFEITYVVQCGNENCQTMRDLNAKESDNFLSLPLEKTEKSTASVSMQDLINAYLTVTNNRNEQVLIHCEKCNADSYHTKCSSKIKFMEHHGYLAIHLRRYSRPTDPKINTPVTFPNGTVSFYDSVKKAFYVFTVEAIIVHIGKTLNSGHYYTVARKGTFNDSRVFFDGGDKFRKILSNGVIRSRQDGKEDASNDAYGYIYFLKQCKPAKIGNNKGENQGEYDRFFCCCYCCC